MKETLFSILQKFDLTEIFKTKGKLRRWSAKRSVGGVLVMAAINDMNSNGVNVFNLVLAGLGVLPLCLSFFEN
jgi:hypothetical protein|tara:strand:+ start:15732 stop:15950 length:219 start_codon:yes stop_codon:yes gene_type:complete